MSKKNYEIFDRYSWKSGSCKDSDVVVSTRVRFARNLRDYPFSPRLDSTGAEEISMKIRAVPEFAGYEYVDMEDTPDLYKAALSERHIISPEFSRVKGQGGLLSSPEDGLYIMIGEEDHVRIQCITEGLDLEGAYKIAAEAERCADNAVGFAFSEKFGYLTHCPTNLGTGMRASVMLFLPAHHAAGRISVLQGELSKLGLTVRGMSGEGSDDSGMLYQVSNQITLGIGEEETIEKLAKVTDSIIKEERRLRGIILENKGVILRDSIRRALGTMRYAELIETGELMTLYGRVRLGASMGIIKGIEPTELDRLLFTSMPAAITASAGDAVKSAVDRDVIRAARVKAVMDR